MVAKLVYSLHIYSDCFNLAKIHMVAKRSDVKYLELLSFNLAKIHMVAKLSKVAEWYLRGFNLAKIHMVAKQIYNYVKS